jgi:hypothetical protein
MLKPGDVTDAIVRALRTGKREVAVPRTRAWLITVGESFPWLRDMLIERLERAGERELARRRAASPSERTGTAQRS